MLRERLNEASGDVATSRYLLVQPPRARLAGRAPVTIKACHD